MAFYITAKPPTEAVVDILCAFCRFAVVIRQIVLQIELNVAKVGDKGTLYFELLIVEAELNEMIQLLVVFYNCQCFTLPDVLSGAVVVKIDQLILCQDIYRAVFQVDRKS